MNKIKLFYTLGVICICSILILSCNTNKNTNESSAIEKNSLHLQLEESLTSKYISTTYSKYNPADMSPSNRTLNQYVVNFSCSAKDFAELQELLVADSKVEIISNSNQPDRQQSKSVNSAKTKSIRENN